MSLPPSKSDPLRIIAVAETWQGADSYAYVRAFRRAGHSVTVIADECFAAPGWRNTFLKLFRRLAIPLIAADLTASVVKEIGNLEPHLLFVYKGFLVQPEAVLAARAAGTTTINVWPDVSVMAHGPYIPKALPKYDWVFTTKTFGIRDMEGQLGVTSSSFIPHAFDPETHHPFKLDASDVARYGCDASFIGTWSPKKESLLAHVDRQGTSTLKIWGAQWEGAEANFRPGTVTKKYALGAEYAKAICASKINIAILSEQRAGSSSGDLVTSRTFHIPACGGFMLHERTDEVREYFVEDKECAMFEGADELADKIRYYLANDTKRAAIAAAGRERSLKSDYSVDARAEIVLAKAREILASRTSNDVRVPDKATV